MQSKFAGRCGEYADAPPLCLRSSELNRKANKDLKPFVEKLRKAKKAIDARGAQEGTGNTPCLYALPLL